MAFQPSKSKKNLNKETYSIRCRGRHSDRQGVFKKYNIQPNHCQDVPVKYAETITVYINKK